MTVARRRGSLAAAILGLVLVGAGVVVALSPRSHARYWTHRMRLRGDDAALARQRLLELGPAAIEDVYAELVAEEVQDRVAVIGSTARVFVADAQDTSGMTDTVFTTCTGVTVLHGPPARATLLVDEDYLDDTRVLLRAGQDWWEKPRRTLFVIQGADDGLRVVLRVPLDDREASVVAAVKARLAEAGR